MGARAFIPAALAAAILFGLAPSTPVAATTTTEAQQIIRIARAQLGDPWRYGAGGPSAFDCSGLVRYAYRRAGSGAVIHSTALRSARSLYLHFKARGLASRTNPRIGDLVIWGYGTHVGIYIGNGRAISTLMNGVRVHSLYVLRARFTAFLHTGMSSRAAITPAPTS
jgi:cell wall-associated NlpC family hydrolase